MLAKQKTLPELISSQDLSNLVDVSSRQLRRRGNIENWPVKEVANKKGGGIQKLFSTSDLPEDIKTKLQSHFLPALKETTQEIKPSIEKISDELPEWANKKALERFDLVNALIEAKDRSKSLGMKKTEALENFLEGYNNKLIFKPISDSLGNVTRSTLLRWEKELKDSGMDYRVLAPKWGKHRAGKNKLTEAEKVQFEIELLNDKKIKIDTAIHHTKVILKHEGLESPSGKAAFRAYAKIIQKRYNDFWTLMREGEKALTDKVLPYLIRDLSQIEVGEVLVADGHVFNFTAINPFTGKPARPLIVVFYDWKSGDVAGASIGFTENVQVIHNALRNAIINLGKTPKFVYLDNGKAFKAKIFTNKNFDLETASVKGVYARLNIQTIFAKPYNARAKAVERFFGDLDSSFSRHQNTFVGSSIKDKPASMNRNEKFLASLNPRKSPDIETVYMSLAKWHEHFYRNRQHPVIKGKTKGEIFDEGRGPGVDPNELRFLMMSEKISKIYPNGINMLGASYMDEALYGLRDKVIVKYELNDLSEIHVYLASTGEFICTAKRWEEVHPIAKHTGSPKDLTELNRKLKFQASLKKRTKQLAKDYKQNMGSLNSMHRLLEQGDIKSIPESISVDGETQIKNDFEFDIDDFQETPQKEEIKNEEHSKEVFHSSEIEKYEYLISQERNLTQAEINWIENDFYKTASGKLIVETEGRKISEGKRLVVNQ